MTNAQQHQKKFECTEVEEKAHKNRKANLPISTMPMRPTLKFYACAGVYYRIEEENKCPRRGHDLHEGSTEARAVNRAIEASRILARICHQPNPQPKPCNQPIM